MKTALVTGASRGIGRAIALALKSKDFSIIGTATSKAGVDALIENGIEGYILDLNSPNSIGNFWEQLEVDKKNISVLVNNAGILVFDRLTRTSQEEFERVMDVNCTGVFLGMQAVCEAMKNQNSGSIVNISSVAGLQGVGFQFSYSVSKWAVRGMTKSAAHELARHNIRVNSVHPGLINTAMLDQFEDEGFNSAAVQVPMGRTASAKEVAELVLWLASNESSYCTGSEFVVDGGISAT